MLAQVPSATSFPQVIGLGATFNMWASPLVLRHCVKQTTCTVIWDVLPWDHIHVYTHEDLLLRPHMDLDYICSLIWMFPSLTSPTHLLSPNLQTVFFAGLWFIWSVRLFPQKEEPCTTWASPVYPTLPHSSISTGGYHQVWCCYQQSHCLSEKISYETPIITSSVENRLKEWETNILWMYKQCQCCSLMFF